MFSISVVLSVPTNGNLRAVLDETPQPDDMPAHHISLRGKLPENRIHAACFRCYYVSRILGSDN